MKITIWKKKLFRVDERGFPTELITNAFRDLNAAKVETGIETKRRLFFLSVQN